MKDLTDALVLITGGASGIGRLAALEFAHLGARVVIWDLDAAALKGFEMEAIAKNLCIRGMHCDVSDREAVYRQAERFRLEYGPLDVLINNAGVVSGQPFLETPDTKVIRSFNVNILAHFWTTRAFLPEMLRRNSGHIVTVASAAGLVGVAGLSDYSASKFGAVGFHEALRMELRRGKSAVDTTVVCPFFIDTGMFQGIKTRVPLLLPILKPEKAAHAIVKAVQRRKKQVILPLFVKGIFFLRLFSPGLLDAAADLLGVNSAMDSFTGRQPAVPAASEAAVFRKAE
jgi:all-trans-retinol dehydrogenase (NAD+)